MKIPSVTAKWLFMLCLPVLLLTASIGGAANSLWLYKYGFERYNVGQDLAASGLELTDSELEDIYAGLISYFNSNRENISLTVVKNGQSRNLFTPEEVIHFRDVKGLIWLDYRVLAGTLVYVLAYAGAGLFRRRGNYRRQLARGVVGSSGITLTVILGLVLLDTIFGFRQLFYQFHRLFFTNPYWSAKGYMLLLFPEPFFNDAARFGTLAIVTGAIALGGVAGGYLLATRKREAI